MGTADYKIIVFLQTQNPEDGDDDEEFHYYLFLCIFDITILRIHFRIKKYITKLKKIKLSDFN